MGVTGADGVCDRGAGLRGGEIEDIAADELGGGVTERGGVSVVGEQDDAIRAVEAELKLREGPAPESSETAALRARVEADPKDHQARYDLALALEAGNDREGAVEQLLELVRRDRKWNDEAARKQLVVLFEAMGPADERTLSGRRKLSSILFS